MVFDWEKEVVLIAAGSYEGVSKALALSAERLKATIIVIVRTKDKGREMFKRKDNTFVFPFNFREVEKVPTLYKTIIGEVKKIPTILINDIRYQVAGFAHNTPYKLYEESYRANALFLVALIQCVLPDMIRQNRGTIANIVSAVIYHSYPGLSAYLSAKAALGAIHEALRAELDRSPVKTLYIRPGGFLSNYWKRVDIDSRIRDFKYPPADHLRDTEYLVSNVFRAIEQGKKEVNLGNLKDRIGYHLNYWAPKVLDKTIAVKNRELIEKHPNS